MVSNAGRPAAAVAGRELDTIASLTRVFSGQPDAAEDRTRHGSARQGLRSNSLLSGARGHTDGLLDQRVKLRRGQIRARDHDRGLRRHTHRRVVLGLARRMAGGGDRGGLGRWSRGRGAATAQDMGGKAEEHHESDQRQPDGVDSLEVSLAHSYGLYKRDLERARPARVSGNTRPRLRERNFPRA